MKYFCFAIALLHTNLLFSQTIIQKNDVINNMVKEVSPDSLQSYLKSICRSNFSVYYDPFLAAAAADPSLRLQVRLNKLKTFQIN